MLAAPEEPKRGVASGVPTQSRVFRLQYKPVDQAVPVVRPLLSEDGTVLLELRRRTITVHDRPDHLQRIQTILEAWDAPPKNVRLTLQIIRARAIEGGEVRLSQELRGVGEALKDVTRWTDYEDVGSVSVTTSEGGSATLDVAEFRIHLILDQVAGDRGTIRLKRFALQRREERADGELTVLGATRLEQSQKAILLTMTASIEE
jgi:hypothetical protein